MASVFSSVTDFVARTRKALVTAGGVAVTVLTFYHQFPFLPDQPLVVVALGALTTVATWLTPNKA